MTGTAELICPRCEGSVTGVPLACAPCGLTFTSWLEIGPSFERAGEHAKLVLTLGLKVPVSGLDELTRMLEKAAIKAGAGQGHALLARHRDTLSASNIPARLVLSPRPARAASTARADSGSGGGLRWAILGLATLGLGLGFYAVATKRGGAAETAATEEATAARGAPAESIDVQRVTASIVSVDTGKSLGTGFVVGPGLILTNRHVVAGALANQTRPIVTFSDGKTATVDIENVSDHTDLALLVCKETHCKEAPALPMRSPTDMKTGETVFAFGNPIGLDLTLSRGILSHRSRKIAGIVFLQTDLAVNPGNSGGPLLDAGGRVVGVVTLKIGGTEGIAFALPIDYYVDVVLDPALRSKILQEYAVSAYRPEFVALKDSVPDLTDARAPGPSEPPPAAAKRPAVGSMRVNRTAPVEEPEPGTPRVPRAELRNERGRGRVLVLQVELELEPGEDLGKSVRFDLETEDGTSYPLGSTSPSVRRVTDGKLYYRFDLEVAEPPSANLHRQRGLRLRVNGKQLSSPFSLERR